MTLRARIIGAGGVVLAAATGVWLFLQWPRWYGTEVLLPIDVIAQPGVSASAMASYPDSHLQLDVAHTLAAAGPADVARVDVRSIGVVWDSRREPRDEAARIRNRTVYLQLKPSGTVASTGEPLWHPASISTTRVADAINLRVRVIGANPAGQLDVDIAGGRLPLAAGQSRQRAAAILKVLPSGRHALVGIITNGGRSPFH